MNTKVKIFEPTHERIYLQESINNFIKDKDVVDIKIDTFDVTTRDNFSGTIYIYHSATVIYKEV